MRQRVLGLELAAVLDGLPAGEVGAPGGAWR
jgi:hypothetical protein